MKRIDTIRFALIFTIIGTFLNSCDSSVKSEAAKGKFQGQLKAEGFYIEFNDCTFDKYGNSYFTGLVHIDYFEEDVSHPKWLHGYKSYHENDMILYKVDSKGKEAGIWHIPECSEGNAIISTQNNDLVVVGYNATEESHMTETGRALDVTISRMSSSGKLLWNKVILRGYEADAVDIIEYDNEFYVLAISDNAYEIEGQIIKVSENGEVLSSKIIEHKWAVRPYALTIKSGKFFVASVIGGRALLLQVVPETGEIANSFEIDEGAYGFDVEAHPNGLVFLSQHENLESRIILLDEALNEKNRTNVNIGGRYQIPRLDVDKSGAIYIMDVSDNEKLKLLKLNSNLELLWEKELEGSNKFSVGNMAISNNGNILICGGRTWDKYGVSDGFYAMFNSNGEILEY